MCRRSRAGGAICSARRRWSSSTANWRSCLSGAAWSPCRFRAAHWFCKCRRLLRFPSPLVGEGKRVCLASVRFISDSVFKIAPCKHSHPYRRDSSPLLFGRRGDRPLLLPSLTHVRERSADWRYFVVWHLVEGAL